jgi:ADP-ribosylglycohydrolase
MNLQPKFRGAIFGLAVGDAVGTTLEFKSPGSFKKIDVMVGGGLFTSRLENGRTILLWPFDSQRL